MHWFRCSFVCWATWYSIPCCWVESSVEAKSLFSSGWTTQVCIFSISNWSNQDIVEWSSRLVALGKIHLCGHAIMLHCDWEVCTNLRIALTDTWCGIVGYFGPMFLSRDHTLSERHGSYWSQKAVKQIYKFCWGRLDVTTPVISLSGRLIFSAAVLHGWRRLSVPCEWNKCYHSEFNVSTQSNSLFA